MYRSNRYIIYSLLLVAVGLALFEYFRAPTPPPAALRTAAPKVNMNERVNYHIKKVDNQRRFDRLKSEVENSQMSYSPGERQPLEALPTGTSVNEKESIPLNQIASDLESESAKRKFPSTPEDQVNEWIESMQLRRDFDSKYRNEYVAAFIENAAQHGYLVKVDDNLRIVEVRRIPARMPQSLPEPKKKKSSKKK